MTYPISITEAMREVVTAVTTELLTTLQAAQTNIVTINYQYGTLTELNNTLLQQGEGRTEVYKKFPLVWLVEPIKQDRRNAREFASMSLDIVICHNTMPTLKSAEREAATFVPILRPIYYELLQQIGFSRHFSNVSGFKTIPHTMTENKYWGTQNETANKLTDYVDAIEINGLAIQQDYQYCSYSLNQ